MGLTVGMLWFDNDPKRDLPAKVARAAKYYYDKYHHVPDTCLVHPAALPAGEAMVSVIKVKTDKYILPGHLWIGIEEANNAQNGQ